MLPLGTQVRAGSLPPSKLNGVWTIDSAERAGTAITREDLPETTLEIRDGKYVFKSGGSVTEGFFTIDDKRKPVAMNITTTGGADGNVEMKAIVALTEDGWQVCYGIPPEGRPSDFSTSPDRNFFLARYVRKPGHEQPGETAGTKKPMPLQVLLISGGCCHDYPGQDIVLSEGISARASTEFTVVRDEGKNGTRHKVSVYAEDNWAAPYDVVIHNECYADEKDPEWLERIVGPHRDGVPAVVVHCAMHSYRVPDNAEWFKFVGVTSHRHGSHFDYIMTNVKPEHPIMAGFPPVWRTPKDELYNIEKVERTATPLATGWSHETKRGEVNVWVNQYGKGRVFGTTIGHYNQTLQDPVVLDLLTRGLLWACDKLQESGEPAAGYGPVNGE